MAKKNNTKKYVYGGIGIGIIALLFWRNKRKKEVEDAEGSGSGSDTGSGSGVIGGVGNGGIGSGGFVDGLLYGEVLDKVKEETDKKTETPTETTTETTTDNGTTTGGGTTGGGTTIQESSISWGTNSRFADKDGQDWNVSIDSSPSTMRWEITKIPLWVTPSQTSGLGSTEINLRVDRNTQGVRKGNIVVTNADGKTDTYIVSQYGTEEQGTDTDVVPDNPYGQATTVKFRKSVVSVPFDSTSTSVTIDVNPTSGTWTLQTPDWITPSQKSGIASKTVKLDFSKNQSQNTRTGVLTVTADSGDTDTMTLTQNIKTAEESKTTEPPVITEVERETTTTATGNLGTGFEINDVISEIPEIQEADPLIKQGLTVEQANNQNTTPSGTTTPSTTNNNVGGGFNIDLGLGLGNLGQTDFGNLDVQTTYNQTTTTPRQDTPKTEAPKPEMPTWSINNDISGATFEGASTTIGNSKTPPKVQVVPEPTIKVVPKPIVVMPTPVLPILKPKSQPTFKIDPKPIANSKPIPIVVKPTPVKVPLAVKPLEVLELNNPMGAYSSKPKPIPSISFMEDTSTKNLKQMR